MSPPVSVEVPLPGKPFLEPHFVLGGGLKLSLDLVCFSVAVKQPNNLPWLPSPPKIKPDQKKGSLAYAAQEPSYLNLPVPGRVGMPPSLGVTALCLGFLFGAEDE